jgi:alpha-methylacyl-CoA racemase
MDNESRYQHTRRRCSLLRHLPDQRRTIYGGVSTIPRISLTLRGALEPQFYSALLKGLELDPRKIPDRDDQSQWDRLRRIFTQKFAEKTQKEWESVFDGTDACVTPVIPLSPKDNRPIAGLSASPSLDVSNVKLSLLTPGAGGVDVLREWLGWSSKDYFLDSKGAVNIKNKARL